MNHFCILSSKKTLICPVCKTELFSREANQHCQNPNCCCNIRLINPNKIKNQNFLRPILKYDLNGQLKNTYENVYECYPLDTLTEKKRRAHVIDACLGKTKRYAQCQWRFGDATQDVEELTNGQAAKPVLQVGFNTKIIKEFPTIKDACTELHFSASTISKACKSNTPPQNADYFLFFKNDFCNHTLNMALQNYQEKNTIVTVKDASGNKIKTFSTKSEAAKHYAVSAQTISNWCNGIFHPSGKGEGYIFECNSVKTFQAKSCKNPFSEGCSLNIEYQKLQLENNQLKDELKTSQEDCFNQQKLIDKCNKELNTIKNRYLVRRYKYDTRIPFMCPIEDFMRDYCNLFTGAIIYILCDSKGKRYVGQSNLENYIRITQHFQSSQQDDISKAYSQGEKFYVERIVTGWSDSFPWNLDDAEAYFIAHYDSKENGYNKTQGNHVYNSMKLEEYNY